MIIIRVSKCVLSSRKGYPFIFFFLLSSSKNKKLLRSRWLFDNFLSLMITKK